MNTVNLGRPIAVPEAKKTEFNQLTGIPSYSWKAIALAVLTIGSIISIDFFALTGELNLLAACLINSCIYYWFFSVMHDAVHRSICKKKWLNDAIGQIATTIFACYASLGLLRWAHMEHHRFTNEEEGDPDRFCHGASWTLPFRWMVIDFYYVYRLLTNKKPQAKKALADTLPYVVLGIAVIAAAIVSGYWLEYLVLWFIPSRLAFIGIGFSFFWLPHAHWPNPTQELRQSKNYTVATVVRLGKEWLLNPLLQYQNYHVIHHLWPTTPFYNNQKVWVLLEPELRQRDLAVAHGFTVQPELVFADQQKAEGA